VIVAILLLVRIPVIRQNISRLRRIFPRYPAKPANQKQTWDAPKSQTDS